MMPCLEMKIEVPPDTNFVILYIWKRIDFLEDLRGLGFIPAVPREPFTKN